MAYVIEIAINHLREIVTGAVDRSLSGQYHSRGVAVAGLDEHVGQFNQHLEVQDISSLGIVQPDCDGLALTLD
jgi:hypothetical protein